MNNMFLASKKGQVVTAIFLILVFMIFWIFALSDLVSTFGVQYVLVNNATGVEAFFYENINLVIMFVLGLAVFGLTRVS